MIRKFVPGFIRRRFAARFGVVLLLTMVLIAGVGFTTFQTVDTEVGTNARNDLESTAVYQAQVVGSWIGNLKTQTRSIAVSDAFEDGGNVRNYLSSRQSGMTSEVQGIHYVDLANGTVEASTVTPIESGDSLSSIDAPWASDLAGKLSSSDGVWVSDSVYQSRVGGDVMALAARVESQPNRAIVVTASVQSRVQKLFQAREGQATSIVNAAGESVYLASGSPIGSGVTPNATAIARTQTNGSFVVEPVANRTTFETSGDSALAYAPVPESDWVVVTTLPSDTAFEAKSIVAGNMILVIAIALASLGAFGVVVGYQTVRPLSTLRDRAKRMEEGDLDVDLETSREDEIGRLYGSFASMRDALKDRIEEAEQARQEAERSKEQVQQLNEHLQEKADDFSDVMTACAAGDLTQRMDPESDSEAMTDIAEGFNTMVEDLEDTVQDVQSFAQEVDIASEQITDAADSVNAASQQVSESVRDISTGADEQRQQIDSIRREMNNLSTTSEEIASTSNEVAKIAEKTAEAGREGQEAIRDAVDEMEEIQERAEAVVDAVEDFASEVEGINEVADEIAQFAEQTNRLALNANIEASREGEDTGFGAVAKEIKDLAEESKEATDQIRERLQSVSERTETTVQEVKDGISGIEEGTRHVEEAIESLDDITEYAQETNDGVQEITAAREEQAASVEETAAMIDEVSSISERTAEKANVAAEAAEDQTAALGGVTESIGDLSDRASDLSETLDRFTTDEGAASSD